MKRIVTLLLAAGLVFGAFSGAQAADVKVKGQWDFAFEWTDNTKFKGSKHGGAGEDDFDARQRLRTQIDIVASEALSGTVYFEIGNSSWGASDAALGADGLAVEVKRSYIDWIVPQTDLKVRMGIQGIALPGFVAGSPILDDDVAGLTASYAFNSNVAVTAGWARPYNQSATAESATTNTFDEMDLGFLAVPVTLDGVKVTPWAMYGQIGKDTQISGASSKYAVAGLLPLNKSGLDSTDSSTDMWWAGLSAEMTMFSPFRVALDGVYGSVDANAEAWDRAGWLIIGAVDYKMDMFTPGIFAWYGSGDDSDAANGSEMMPYIAPDFGPTSFGFNKVSPGIATEGILSGSGAGTWGIGLQAKDIMFLEGLKHTFRVAYVKGTNAKNLATAPTDFRKDNFGVYLTEEDSAWEVNFDHAYKIYENLDLLVEMGYIKLDMDKDVWAAKGDFDDAWKFGINLKYGF